jgi:hypothetical protein
MGPCFEIKFPGKGGQASRLSPCSEYGDRGQVSVAGKFVGSSHGLFLFDPVFFADGFHDGFGLVNGSGSVGPHLEAEDRVLGTRVGHGERHSGFQIIEDGTRVRVIGQVELLVVDYHEVGKPILVSQLGAAQEAKIDILRGWGRFDPAVRNLESVVGQLRLGVFAFKPAGLVGRGAAHGNGQGEGKE